MKNLGTRIFITSRVEASVKRLIFCHIRVIIIKNHGKLSLSLGKANFLNFSVSYPGPIRAGDLSVGTLVFETLQALVIRWYYLGGGAHLQGSPFENVQKDCP